MRTIALLLTGILAALALPTDARAATSSTWSVTVSNPTQNVVELYILYGMDKRSEKIVLNPNASYKYDVPGAWCPYEFEGTMFFKGTNPAGMQKADCLGNHLGGASTTLATCCWNLDFRVCQVSGPANSTLGGDYSFCK